MKFSFPWHLFLFWVLPIVGLHTEPKLPKEPNLPVISGESEPRNARGETETKETRVLSLTLCDGRTVRGEGSVAKGPLVFEHQKEGILYKKKLNPNELESIRIDSWELKLKSEDKKGTSFEVLPKQIRIRTRNGEIYYKDTGLQDLKLLSVDIQNQNGETKLFSYWMDLRYPDGKWYSGLPQLKPGKSLREECLKDVIRLFEWE